MNKILVLGASGNIGNFLLQELEKKNSDYFAGVPFDELDKIKRSGARGIPLDFGDKFSLNKSFKGFDSIFMLLPMAEPMNGWSRNIIEAARKNDIKFILRSSLLDAAPDSEFFLFKQHGQIDQIVRECGIPYAIVHPNSFMQNFAVYYEDSINSSGSFSLPWGDSKISYVDVRDIAASSAQILTNPERYNRKEYSLTGPKPISNHEIAEILTGSAGRRVSFSPVDDEQYESYLKKTGMSEWDIKAMVSLSKNTQQGRREVVSEDVRNITGRAPIPFERFAHDYSRVWTKVLA